MNAAGVFPLQIVWFAAITLAVTLFIVIDRIFEIAEHVTPFNVLLTTLRYQVLTVNAGGS